VSILVVCGLFALWRFRSDMVGAQRSNNRGIGHMEQFDYDSAVKDFEDAVSQAPRWTPAKINLGIALLSRAQSEEVDD